MTRVSLFCDRRNRSRPDQEQTTPMYPNSDREQRNQKRQDTERKHMLDEALSVEWRWVAASSSEEDERNIEEEWEREQMKSQDFDLGDAE